MLTNNQTRSYLNLVYPLSLGTVRHMGVTKALFGILQL